MKDTLIEVKNNWQGNKSRVDEAKNQINDLGLEEAKNNQSEQRGQKIIIKKEESVKSLWDNFKWSNIGIIGVTEGEEKAQEIGNLFEKVMEENVPNSVKEIDMQVQAAQSPKQDGCREAHSKTHHN